MVPLAVTKKGTVTLKQKDTGFGIVLTEGHWEWDCGPMVTARMPSYKAGMRAAQGYHLQRSSLLTKKPT